jgi:hypothetical protein
MPNADEDEVFYQHPMYYINNYPRIIEIDNRKYISNVSNIMLMYDEIYQDSSSNIGIGYNLWILRAVWKDKEILVEVEMAPGHTMETFFPALWNETLGKRMISIRHIKPGALRFLEKEFIASLPLAMEYTGNLFIVESKPLLFRISPKGVGETMGYFFPDTDNDFNKSNPGYAKLAADFFSAIPWVFAEWLIEDGHKIDKKWLAEMKKEYPKRKLDQ